MKTHRFLILSEATLPRLLWCVLRRQPVCVVSLETALPQSRGPLGKLLDRLRARGKVQDLGRDRPELLPTQGFNATIDLRRLTAVYPEREDQLSQVFDFERADAALADDALAYKHICSNAMLHSYYLLYTLRNIEDGGLGPVAGITTQMADLYQAIFDRPPQGRSSRLLAWTINPLMAVAVLAYGVWTALRLIRQAPPPARQLFLMSDNSDDPRDEILWDEVVEDKSSFLAVCRHDGQKATFARRRPDLSCVGPGDGWLDLREAPGALCEYFARVWRMFRFAARFDPHVVRQLLALPWRRLRTRALFRRFQPRFFWSRDDYNPDHILRTQELRRVGAVSLGIMHGVPTSYACVEQMRYIDFDIYYLFGMDQYERWYKKRWPAEMKVRTVGSFGLTRADLERFAAPRPRNITSYPEPSFYEDEVFAALRRLAEEFPDRTVYVNVKQNRKVGEYGRKLARLIAEGPPNLVEHTGRSYDLMFDSSYVIVDGSTLALEAVQFGLAAFHLDFDQRWKQLYYRDFPELCVRSVDELIEKIRRLDAGAPYPRRCFAHAIELSGRVIWDVIRGDMDLPPRQSAPLPHLAFAEGDDRPLNLLNITGNDGNG